MDNNVESNKALVHAYIDAINLYNWDILENILSDEFIRHSFAAGEPAVRSRADLIQFLRTQHKIYPKFQDKILDLIAEGDKVTARHSFRGTQLGKMGSFPISHKDVNFEYLAIYRIKDGAIAEAWVEWDNYTSMKQLGFLDMMKPN